MPKRHLVNLGQNTLKASAKFHIAKITGLAAFHQRAALGLVPFRSSQA